jgi:hypothetical protein
VFRSEDLRVRVHLRPRAVPLRLINLREPGDEVRGPCQVGDGEEPAVILFQGELPV